MRFIKARPYQLDQAQEQRVLVRYEDQPSCRGQEESFDMVVLSVGIRPNRDNYTLSARLDVPVNEFGFFDTTGQAAGATARGGIYVAGTARAPMDIAHAVAEARAVAGAIIATQPE
jgi:heterodisulfide reductase subunit A